MRAVIWASVMLFLVIAFITTNTVIIRSMLNETIKEVDDIKILDAKSAGAKFTVCYEKFKKRERYINLSVTHSDIAEIEASFAEIIGAASANNLEEMIITKNRLINSLEHLRRISGINSNSVLFIYRGTYPQSTHTRAL